jgi:hypothetical protein
LTPQLLHLALLSQDAASLALVTMTSSRTDLDSKKSENPKSLSTKNGCACSLMGG